MRHQLALIAAVAHLAGCSYWVQEGVKGHLGASNLVGTMTFQAQGNEIGSLYMQVPGQLSCLGWFKVQSESAGIGSFRFSDRVYEGTIACTDRRSGKARFVSPAPNADGRSGVVHGQLGEQSFTLEVGVNCGGKRCGDLIKAPLNELELMRSLQRIVERKTQ